MRTTAATLVLVTVAVTIAAGASARPSYVPPPGELCGPVLDPSIDVAIGISPPEAGAVTSDLGIASEGATTAPCYDWSVDPPYAGPYFENELEAAAADPVPPAAVASAQPTWRNLYDWPNGHGYVGWHEATSTPGAYGMQPALGGNYGLWLWPLGGDYTDGSFAEWTYTAPGTTRIQKVSLSFAYRNKLLAHHCLVVGLRTAAGAVAQNEWCKPVTPPDSQRDVQVTLVDPSSNPTSKVLFFKVRMDCKNQPGCTKHIPTLDPLQTAGTARLKFVDMTLVDDDLPLVVPQNEFRDLDGKYIRGLESYTLDLLTSDPGSGVERHWLERLGIGMIYSANAPCDPMHHTPDLDNRICPQQFNSRTTVATAPFPEGANRFVAKASDLARNVGSSDEWVVYVDRTPPAPVTNIGLLAYDDASRVLTVGWDTTADPDLPDGTPGSGVQGFEVRYSRGGGALSEWDTTDLPELELENSFLGESVSVEVRPYDGAGNVAASTTASVTAFAATREPPWYEAPEEDLGPGTFLSASRADRAVEIARADSDVIRLVGANATVADLLPASNAAGSPIGAQVNLSGNGNEITTVVSLRKRDVVEIGLESGTRSARRMIHRLANANRLPQSRAQSTAAAAEGYTARNLRRISKRLLGAVGEDIFWNYDFKKSAIKMAPYNPESKNHVDWPVTLVFHGVVDVQTAKDLFNRGQGSASTQYGRVRDRIDPGQTDKLPGQYTRAVYDGDSGAFDGDPGCFNRKYHYRVYAPGPEERAGSTRGRDRMWNRAWTYYVVATTHIDNEEGCQNEGLGNDPWTGDSEASEEHAAEAARHHTRLIQKFGCLSPIFVTEDDPWKLVNPVSGQTGQDTLRLYNRDFRGRIVRDGPDLILKNNGDATMIQVDHLSHPPEGCFS